MYKRALSGVLFALIVKNFPSVNFFYTAITDAINKYEVCTTHSTHCVEGRGTKILFLMSHVAFMNSTKYDYNFVLLHLDCELSQSTREKASNV